MIHIYDIDRLGGQADADLVKERLSSVEGVRTVAVSLERNDVTIDMDHHIKREAFDAVLMGSGPWRLSNERMPQPAGTERGILVVYAPLIGAFAVIIAAAFIGQYRAGLWNVWDGALFMRHVMAGFFLLFGGLKFLNLAGFVGLFRSYDLIGSRVTAYAWLYPVVEVTLGVAYLTAWHPATTNTATLILMLVGIIGVSRALRTSKGLRCACLGSWVTIPLSWVTVAEYAAMGAMAGRLLYGLI